MDGCMFIVTDQYSKLTIDLLTVLKICRYMQNISLKTYLYLFILEKKAYRQDRG